MSSDDAQGAGDGSAERRLTAERERLSELRRSLRQGLSGESENESLSELSDVDQHPADTGTETFNRERDLGILDSVEAELADVESALGRLDAGTYGVCEACGRPIGPERLEALPATRFCVDDAELSAAEAAPGVVHPVATGGDDLREPGRPI